MNPIPPTITVVDNTSANARQLDEMLRRRGYRVTVFPRGDLALEAAKESPPGLILLDTNIPWMNGFEACAHLQAEAALAEIPVLFLSALSVTDSKLKAFPAEGVDYITRPFQSAEVHARAETHPTISHQHRELQVANEVANEKLSELESLRDSLVHMIVHGRRSPLTGIGVAWDRRRGCRRRLSSGVSPRRLVGRSSPCTVAAD